MKHIISLLGALLVAASVSGCTTTDLSDQNDPYEGTNREIFALDQGFDHAIARPVAVFYNQTVPTPARTGLHNFLANLDSPVIFANDLLQGEGGRAKETLRRAILNSTFGLGGIFDVAGKWGYPGHEEDFGQTLGVWGAGEGPYMVLPFAGPSNPRDLAGVAGDYAMDPFTYLKWNNSTLHMALREGLGILDLRARNVDSLDQIERTSVDLYATTRSLYRQHRDAEIRNGAPDTQNLPNL